MIRIFKSYFPMFLSLLFYAVCTSFIGVAAVDPGFINVNNFWVFLVLILFLVLSILIEMVIFIVMAAKNKELGDNRVLWAILIYFFNIFIIPFYNLKYVVKTDKIKLKMVIYIILIVVTCVMGIVVPKIVIGNRGISTIYVQSENNEVEFVFYGNYIEREVGDYDIYVSDYARQINIGAFLYSSDNVSVDDIHNTRNSWIYSTREEVNLIHSYSDKLSDREIVSYVYSGVKEGNEFIYKISTIAFNDSKYIVNTIQITFMDDYEKYEEELCDVLENVRIIND